MLGSAIPDILVQPIAVEGFRELGHPVYLLPFTGIAKFPGVVVILVPGFPRIKEWAFAGLIIDLTGATYSIISSGEPASAWGFMALPLIPGIGSYMFYHKKERMRLLASIYPIVMNLIISIRTRRLQMQVSLDGFVIGPNKNRNGWN